MGGTSRKVASWEEQNWWEGRPVGGTSGKVACSEEQLLFLQNVMYLIAKISVQKNG